MFPLFEYFTRVGKNHLCFTQAITIPSFLWISIAQDVLRDILELPFTPGHIKKKHHKVNPSWLHPSDSRWFSLLPSPSASVACYRRTTKDICEKRNVHECLQCPPHWNTWGKVSSLTLWSIPAPQLEPQRLVPPPMRSSCFFWRMGDCLSHEGSLGRIGTTLKAVRRVSSSKNVQWDLGFWRAWCWRRLLSSFSNFQSFYGSGDCRGGRGRQDFGEGEMAFYVA